MTRNLLIRLESVTGISVRSPQSQLRQTETIVTALSGIDLKFYCITDRQGMYWTVDNRRIVENETFSFLFGGRQLRVFSVNENNSGVYKCLNRTNYVLGKIKLVVEKGTHKENSRKRLIRDLLVVPELEAVSSKVRAVEGKRATLGCHCSSSYSTVRWLWTKNSSSPSNLKGFTSERKGNGMLRLLHISNVELDHEATYVCESWAFNRHSSAEVHLEVIVPAKIISKPFNIERTAGLDAQFSCQAAGKPEPQITWHKYPEEHIILKKGSSLKLKNVRKGDEGTYVCNATNFSGMSVTESAQLSIKGRQTSVICKSHAYSFVEPNRQPSAAIIGGRISLECYYQRQLHPPSITWFKNAQDVEALHDKRIKQTHFRALYLGQITITNATWQDAAEYTCTVRSITNHSVLLKKYFNVKIYGEPEFKSL